MSQINYNMEIVRKLLKSKIHIRGLAKELNTNAMMISRKLKDLFKGNIVDFAAEGKNKIFFLKDTIEAKSSMLMAENYALLRTLNQYPGLRGIIEKIQNDKRVKVAVLFGSYAKGTAKKDSDIDVYIKSSDLSLKRELSLIDSKLSIKIGNLNKDNYLVKEIKKNHVIIKGAGEYYEKTGFFGKTS